MNYTEVMDALGQAGLSEIYRFAFKGRDGQERFAPW